MAKRAITVTSCDFDSTEGAQSIRFGIDGRDLEVDLSPKREKALREFLAPYVDRAHRFGTEQRRTVTRAGREVVSTKDRNAAVRAWAIEQGYEVSERGRIRADIIAEYDAAH